MSDLRAAAQLALDAFEYHIEQTRPLLKTSQAIATLRAALEAQERNPLTDEEIEALKIDAECFRFWVREAANAPCDMANLIAKCTTEQDYRDAIMPVAFAAEKAIKAAIRARGEE